MNVLTATPDQLLWYDNSIIMTFIGVTLGALIGFTGSIIQSKISAKNNIELLKLQSEKEIAQKRYFEKEKLYSDIIEFLPQLMLSANLSRGINGKVVLAKENKVLQNSLKPRLHIYSTKEITKRFLEVYDYMLKETDDLLRVNEIEKFCDMLLEDLDASKKQI